MNPSIYIRSKVPQAIQDTLIQISEMRKAWNISNVVSFNLFPTAEVFLFIKPYNYFSCSSLVNSSVLLEKVELAFSGILSLLKSEIIYDFFLI